MTQPFCKNKPMARGAQQPNDALPEWKKMSKWKWGGEESKGSQGRGEIELWGLTGMNHLPRS